MREIRTSGSMSGGWKRNYGSRSAARSESDGIATGPYGRRASPRLYRGFGLMRSASTSPLPGWRKTFDPLRDAFDHEHGWSRPDDPARAKVEQPGYRAYIEAAQLRAGLRLESSPGDLIRDCLLQRVEHGTVRNRADVVSALRDAGLGVPRQGKD